MPQHAAVFNMENVWQCTPSEVTQETTQPISQETIETDVQQSNKIWDNSKHLIFYLRWNHFQTNMTKVFAQLLQTESFVDVTLACDGHSIKAHKIVLSACSPYFQSLFSENPCQHPIVIMRDITWPQLQAIVEFMYKGEINVPNEQLAPLLMVAEMLKIRGLTEVSADQETTVIETPTTLSSELSTQIDVPADINPTATATNGRKRNSSDNSAISETSTTTYISLATHDPQLVSTKITTVNKSSTTLQTLSTQPYVTYTRNSTSQDTESSDNKIKAPDEPVIKKKKRNSSSSAPTNSDNTSAKNNNKPSSWTQNRLQEAIQAVVSQKMRFTQASNAYGIPKGTLYDNILGKTNRMSVLDEAGLSTDEESIVLDFCCDVSVSPYNRRTNKSLISVLEYVVNLRRKRDPEFAFAGLAGFRWWWAFCKKHSIVSLYYDYKIVTNSPVKDEDCSIDSPV